MVAVLSWLGKAAWAVISWAWAHPVAAVIVGVAIVVSAAYIQEQYPIAGVWLVPVLQLVAGTLLAVSAVRSLLPSSAHIPIWTRVAGVAQVAAWVFGGVGLIL